MSAGGAASDQSRQQVHGGIVGAYAGFLWRRGTSDARPRPSRGDSAAVAHSPPPRDRFHQPDDSPMEPVSPSPDGRQQRCGSESPVQAASTVSTCSGCSPTATIGSPSTVSRSTTSTLGRVCRFCLAGEDDSDSDTGISYADKAEEFVNPCPCRGSSKYVHLSCLVQCFLAHVDWHNFKCPTCKEPYVGRALQELADISRARMVQDYGEKAPQVAHSLCYLAQAHAQLGNVQKSKDLFEQGLSISEAHFGIGHVATAPTLAELASACGKLGDVKKQRQLLERSLEIKEKYFGTGHINTAVTLNNLATVHSELGNVQQEKVLLERSLEIKELHFGKGHVQTTPGLVNLAGVYSELGDVAKGLQLLELSLEIEERHFGAGHVETAITLNNMALACGEGGDMLRMRELLLRSLKIKEHNFGVEHQELCLTLANLGITYAALGEVPEAQAYCQRALSVFCDPDALASRRQGVVFLRIACVQMALGQDQAAIELNSRAVQALRVALGPAASSRVLALECARMSRIWVVAKRHDVVEYLRLMKSRSTDGPDIGTACAESSQAAVL